MNHEVFQYQNKWYYFKESTSSECTSGCDFRNSPFCGLTKAQASLPLCKGRTIKKIKPYMFAPNDTVTVLNTERVYDVMPAFASDGHCSTCEFNTSCNPRSAYCCTNFTLQRCDVMQSQPKSFLQMATMPKVIRLSMRNYIDENSNIYDLRAMPRLFNVGDRITIDDGSGACESYVCRKISSFNTPGKSCSLLNCKAESFCRNNSYLCKYGTALVPESVDFSAKYMKESGGIECSKCAANIPNSGCCAHVIEVMNGIENHVTCNGTFHYVKEPQQPIVSYVQKANQFIRSEPPLTPKESFPVEKHITIKRSSFKPKITKLKEVKWKTQTTKNR